MKYRRILGQNRLIKSDVVLLMMLEAKEVNIMSKGKKIISEICILTELNLKIQVQLV